VLGLVSCGDQMQQARHAGNLTVGPEARDEVFDQADAPRGVDAAGQEQRLNGGGYGRFGLFEVEVAGRPIREEDATGLAPGGGQHAFAVGDELVRAGGVAEVQEGLAGVDGEVGVGKPGAPGGAFAGGLVEVFLGCGERA